MNLISLRPPEPRQPVHPFARGLVVGLTLSLAMWALLGWAAYSYLKDLL